jgi:predicted molibdopterin-dependent oxidoreductase YjgC
VPGISYERMLAGGVHALLVAGENPAEEPGCAESLRQLEFLVVQDLFLTETAQLANVVLPACSFAEADATYTNLERRLQRAPQAIQAAGESRPDWAILAALADRWLAGPSDSGGVQIEAASAAGQPAWKKKRRKTRQGQVPKPWNYPNAQAVLEEVTKAVTAYANLRWDALGEFGLQWQMSAPARPGRRPEASTTEPVVPPAAGSYWLVDERLLWDGGVLMRHGADQVRALIPPPFAALNPDDAAAAGLAEGSNVSVSSSHGTVSLILRVDASVQPGTAWVPGGQAGLPSQVLGAGRGDPVSVRLAPI